MRQDLRIGRNSLLVDCRNVFTMVQSSTGFSVGQSEFLNDRLVEWQGTVPERFLLWDVPIGLMWGLSLCFPCYFKASPFLPSSSSWEGRRWFPVAHYRRVGEKANEAFDQCLQVENWGNGSILNWLFCVCAVEEIRIWFIFSCAYPVFSSSFFLMRFSSSKVMFLTSLSKFCWLQLRDLFLVSALCHWSTGLFLWQYCSVSVPMALWSSLKSGVGTPPVSFFLFRIALAFWDLFIFIFLLPH